MRRDRVRSRLIGMLKVALPLAALTLLSMLFMLSRTIDPEAALPYAQVDIEELLRDPRLTAPSFSGMTMQGDEVEFTAATAHPGGSEAAGARALDPLLRLIAPDGRETRVTAREAHIDPSANELILSDKVVIEDLAGYRLESEQLFASLDQSKLKSPGSVKAEAPGVTVSSDMMTLTKVQAEDTELLVFKGNVKLLYQPEPTAPAAGEKLP